MVTVPRKSEGNIFKRVYPGLEFETENVIEIVKRQFSADAWKNHGKLFTTTLSRIEESPKTMHALRMLLEKGCNPAVILRELGLFCGVDGTKLEKRTEYAKKQLESISARLKEDAQIVAQLVEQFSFDDYGHLNQAELSAPPLHDVAKAFALATDEFKKRYHLKIIRNRHLVYLRYHIEAVINKPSYKTIALLVSGVTKHNQHNINDFAESLRRKLERQEKADVSFFRAAKISIHKDLSTWQYFFT